MVGCPPPSTAGHIPRCTVHERDLYFNSFFKKFAVLPQSVKLTPFYLLSLRILKKSCGCYSVIVVEDQIKNCGRFSQGQIKHSSFPQLVKEYQDSLELAKKQDAAVLECVKQEFTESLLSRPLFEHDRHIKQCKRSEGASAELHAHLLTLDGLVKTFDRQKEEADTFVTQLEEQSARRMSTLSSDVKAPGVDTTDIDERLQMNATAFEADVTLMNNHVEQMATTMTQLAETAALCSGLIDASEKEAASGEELSSEYIQRLDVAVATYRRVEVLMKEGQQFYVSMMDSTEKLCNRVTGFVVAVGAQQNELSRVLGLENRTNTQIQGDATLAQSMQQEEKTLNQQRVQEQINADKHYAQALNDPPAAPPAAPSAPVVYNEAFTGASAPPASPTDLPASGVPPPMQNPYMARHAW